MISGLARPATRGGHANALEHLAGYVSDALTTEDRHALRSAIHAFRRGERTLHEPARLLRAHLARHGRDYVNEQVYLEPDPAPSS
jgi:uncharacterized protein YbgA (DUF1722 family)